MRHFVLALMAGGCFLTAGARGATCDDLWELGGIGGSDDDALTENILRHGVVQQHDLQGTAAVPDQDWMRVVVKSGHSYEARVSGLYWDELCGAPPCPRFDRVDSAGTVLTPGQATNEEIVVNNASIIYSLGRTVRWISSDFVTNYDFLRAIGDEAVSLGTTPYDIELYDTTLFVPRWNNSATQTTVFILKNTTNMTVDGTVGFFNVAGLLLWAEPFSVPEHGARIMNLAGIPALVGASGVAEIAQMGGYGAITGKAVALEPATGFTFDTQITPIPR